MKLFPHDKRHQLLIKLLRDIRKEKGLRQAEVAELLGKPQSYVSKYETGERRIDPVELYLICNVMEVRFSRFADRFEKELE